MGLFSKKEKVPEIPPASLLPDVPPKTENSSHPSKNLPELPSFPTSQNHENLNQEIVKSAVNDTNSSEDNEVIVEELPRDFHPNSNNKPQESHEHGIPPVPQKPKKRTLELSETNTPEKKVTKSHEPIFVRIDKFKAAQKEFEQIKSKIKEAESALKKVKELKEKEEKEIKEWTGDLENVKSRLAEIDSSIFDQL